jgi:hypothetical protein
MLSATLKEGIMSPDKPSWVGCVIGVAMAMVLGSGAIVAAQTKIPLSQARFHWNWTPGSGTPATEFRIACGPELGVYTHAVVVEDVMRRDFPVRDVIAGPGVYYCVIMAANDEYESSPSAPVVFRRTGRTIITD